MISGFFMLFSNMGAECHGCSPGYYAVCALKFFIIVPIMCEILCCVTGYADYYIAYAYALNAGLIFIALQNNLNSVANALVKVRKNLRQLHILLFLH